MKVLFACMYCVPHACLMPVEVRRVSDLPDLELLDDCERGAGN